jgi:hypothetical protein
MADAPVKNSSAVMYFAARPEEEIVGHLRQKIVKYYEYLESYGHAERIRKSQAYNSGGTLDDNQACTWRINRGGEDGEMLLNAENHYRAIGQSQVNLICAQRPTVNFLARNSDKQSIARASVANGLVEHYLTEVGLEAMFKDGCENAVFTTEGFYMVDWDPKLGPTAGRALPEEDENGEPVVDEMGVPATRMVEMPVGDVRVRLFGPFDVIRDVHSTSYRELTWKILRTWVNKWDLASRYPEVADKITHMGGGNDAESRISPEGGKDDNDLLPVYEFYHEKTPAVPEGRYVKFVKELWLEGGPLPFKKIPLTRECPAELKGTPFAYSAMLDLLGAQETVNGLDTSMTTNQLGRGIGNMLVPRNANMSLEQFGSSMNAIKYDGELEPKALTMPPTPAEFFQYKKDKISAMEVISGINSVVRGSPSEAVGADASGSKLALLQAQAVQQNNGLEKNHVQAIRDVAMNIIRVFRAFGGSEQRVLQTIGKYNSYKVREFMPSDLEDIENLTVDIGNPVTRQISGRMAIADRLVELGLIKQENMRHYITLIRDGVLDPLVEGTEASMLRIEEENEKLLAGDQTWQHRALLTDEHWVEIPKHLELLDNPDLRLPEAEPIQMKILEAVQEHLQLFRAMPPELVMMRGGPNALAMWQQMQMMAQGIMPGAAPGTEPAKPQDGKSSVQDAMAKDGQAAQPQMPQQPKNPATGQRAPGARGVTDAS